MPVSQIIGWLLMGLVSGTIAKVLMPGADKGGLITTVLLGIAGGFVGGWLGSYVGVLGPGLLSRPDPGDWLNGPDGPLSGSGGLFGAIVGLATATVGAVVLLMLYRWLRR